MYSYISEGIKIIFYFSPREQCDDKIDAKKTILRPDPTIPLLEIFPKEMALGKKNIYKYSSSYTEGAQITNTCVMT